MTHPHRPGTAAEWLVALEAAVLLPCAALAVRTMPLGRAVRLIAAYPGVGLQLRLAPARVAQLVTAVGRRMRFRCLPQALVTSRLLSREGVPCEVIIGTVKSAGSLRAHAWVRVAGQPLDDGDVSAYEPIYMVTANAHTGRQAA
jgi:hypothetical protein